MSTQSASRRPVANRFVAEPRELRHAFGAFATGVTVVTVGGEQPHGMTANSFSTVSLDPPLVSVCVGRDAVMHESLTTARRYAFSVLAADQEHIARYFADTRRPLGREQFNRVAWRPGPRTGAPLINGAVAYFECGLWRSYNGGDHTIFVGKLLSMDRRDREDVLAFLSGQFHRIERARSGAAL